MSFLSLQTHTRDDLIEVGRLIGQWAKSHKDDFPKVVTLSSLTSNDGKSLLALAAHSALTPSLYPNGVEVGMNADFLLDMDPYEGLYPSVVFQNCRGKTFSHPRLFDREMGGLKLKFQRADLIIVSNLYRTATGLFNYAAQGMGSELLDANIDFEKTDPVFARKLNICSKDPMLVETLKTFTPQSSALRQPA